MIEQEVAFLGCRHFSSQSELFKYFSIALVGWMETGPLGGRRGAFVLIM